jgi:hypothetical protein
MDQYGQRQLTRQQLEFKEQMLQTQFNGGYVEDGRGKISVDDAAVFASEKVSEALEDAHDASPNSAIEAIRIQEATKRTTIRWRYGSTLGILFMAFIALAGLTASGH